MPFPHRLAWLIDNPFRRSLVRPATLIERMGMAPTDRVLEVGPGSGYFTTSLLAGLPAGTLHVVDVQPEMLAKVRQRTRGGLAKQPTFACGDLTALPFASGSFDVVLVVAVLGETPSVRDSLRAVFRALRPGGGLLVHEHLPDPDMVRFGIVHELALAAGFRQERRWGSWWNYSVLFRRPEPSG